MKLDSDRSRQFRQYAWIAAVGGAAATVAQRTIRNAMSRGTAEDAEPRQVLQRITIGGDPAAVARKWRVADLPRFVPLLRAAEVGANGAIELVADLPGGNTGRWALRVADKRGDGFLRWELVSADRQDDAESVSGFAAWGPAPADRGTEITLAVEHGNALFEKTLGGASAKLLREALRRFKQWTETGEIATTEGQPSGRVPMRERPELRAAAQRCLDERRRRTEIVDNAVEESFPASDPPAFGRGV